MKQRLQKIIYVFKRNTLASNIFSLSILQAANYLLPLITLPYLVRILGPEYFGLIAFATATITYFILITDYGFNISATRQISIHREDLTKVSLIYSSVITVKLFLLLLSFIMLYLLVSFTEKFSINAEVYYFTFTLVIGNCLFPVWVFQGLEKMHHITILNVCSKLFFTILVFVIVHEQNDYLFVPLLTGLGYILAGVWSLILIRERYGIKFSFPTLSSIIYQLKEGHHVFFSTIIISFYTVSATFVLGIFTNNSTVGFFAAADRIIQAAKSIYTPIAQAIFPFVSKKFEESKSLGMEFIFKVSKWVGLLMLIISCCIFIFAEQIVLLVLGEDYISSILLVKIMSFLPFIISQSNIFGIQTMLNLGYGKEFLFFVSLTALLGFVLGIFMIPLYSANGVAMILLFIEVFITIMLVVFVIRKFMRGNL